MYRYRSILLLLFTLLLTACATTAPPGTQPLQRPAKVALVLGAGASKGFAHVGVIKVLESQKIPVQMVVGTSAGSFVGSLYAYGYNGFALQDIAMKLQKKEVAELTIPDNGFIKGERLRNFINDKVRNQPIEKLKLPFFAVATDIRTGKETVFNTGNTGMAVQASAAVPGIYQPARFSGNAYVDGGLVNPVAVDVARRYGADLVIAVDITYGVENSIPTGTMETIMKSFEIMYHTIAQSPVGQADVVIKPQVGFMGAADFDKRHEAILAGEKAAWEAMPAILEKVNRLRQEGRL
jgi:NTE family protein